MNCLYVPVRFDNQCEYENKGGIIQKGALLICFKDLMSKQNN